MWQLVYCCSCPLILALLLFLLWSAQSPFSASRQQNSKTAKQESRAAQGQHRFALEMFSNKCQSLYFRLQLGAWPNCCHSGLWIQRFPVRVLVSQGSTTHRSQQIRPISEKSPKILWRDLAGKNTAMEEKGWKLEEVVGGGGGWFYY